MRSWRMARALVAGTAGLLALAAAGTDAAATVSLSLVTSAAIYPVYITHAGDSRLFVVELAGRIRILDPNTGTFLATPFLDIQSKVSTGDERGLFTVAFHPDYASNGYFYVDYTNLAGNTVIERYHVTSNPNVADATSGVTLLLITQPFSNHNGGQLQIGPRDGYLYIGMGDGGSSGDPSCFAQRKDSLLGKMLRLNVRANLTVPPYYGIPSDNPFTGAADPTNQVPDEIWALGLRNPWRFSFDRVTGDLFIGDVGQDLYEEVDLHRAGSPGGQNYGWKEMEAFHCYSNDACPAGTPPCNDPSLTLPITEYPHAADCSIVGGYFYRGSRAPELAGRYLFGDYCSGDLRTLTEATPGNWQTQALLQTPSALTSFGEDVSGELYLAAGGDIYKLVSDATPPNIPAVGLQGLLGLALSLVAAGGVLARARASRRRGSSAT